MSTVVAVPSFAPGGLGAKVSEHFGHCGHYTVVELDGDNVVGLQVARNAPHEEEDGGCMKSVLLLSERGVRVLLSGGMGELPLEACREVGIEVLDARRCGTVGDAVEAYAAGILRPFGKDQACRRHSGESAIPLGILKHITPLSGIALHMDHDHRCKG